MQATIRSFWRFLRLKRLVSIAQVPGLLVLRGPDGREKCIAEAFEHSLGLLYFDLFWHHTTPEKAAHIVKGVLSGDGPWRIGDFRIRNLGCHNTDPHLIDQSLEWKHYLQSDENDYPPKQQIFNIAKKMGALNLN